MREYFASFGTITDIVRMTDKATGNHINQIIPGMRILKIWSIRFLDNKNKITKFFQKYSFYFFNI